MPDVNSMFPSKWLKVADLNGGTIDVVVSHVIQEEIKQGEMVWVIHFHPNPQLPHNPGNPQPGAVLKPQNADAISTIYGPSTENWAGQSIQLYVKQTNMGPGIGMRPVAAAFEQAARMPAVVAPVGPVPISSAAPQPPVGPATEAAALAKAQASQAQMPTQEGYGAGPQPTPTPAQGPAPAPGIGETAASLDDAIKF